ncbi:MAG: Double zinc ribbon [Bacteroidetes bacterium]|nr:Double zinc ribbon [Bacteroidota bacterium]
MNCHKCKTEIPDGSKFCNICGSEMDVQGKTCPNTKCSKTGLSHEALFCPDCGAELTEEQSDDYDKKVILILIICVVIVTIAFGVAIFV